MSKTPGDYLAGLAEGEGSFYAFIKRTSTSPSGLRAGVGFSIVLANSPEAWQLLLDVAETLECGTVRPKADNRPGHRQQVRYKVEGNTQLRTKVIPFFQHHILRGPKCKEFKLWCQILEILKQGSTKLEVIEQVKELRATLNHGGRDRKY